MFDCYINALECVCVFPFRFALICRNGGGYCWRCLALNTHMSISATGELCHFSFEAKRSDNRHAAIYFDAIFAERRETTRQQNVDPHNRCRQSAFNDCHFCFLGIFTGSIKFNRYLLLFKS